jgi:hypothetical protein
MNFWIAAMPVCAATATAALYWRAKWQPAAFRPQPWGMPAASLASRGSGKTVAHPSRIASQRALTAATCGVAAGKDTRELIALIGKVANGTQAQQTAALKALRSAGQIIGTMPATDRNAIIRSLCAFIRTASASPGQDGQIGMEAQAALGIVTQYKAAPAVVDLQDALLSGAMLQDANLAGADLTDAHLDRACLVNAKLQGAFLKDAQLKHAALAGANLAGAHLNRANLTGADFSFAVLSGADFAGAILSAANLHGADITGATFAGATYTAQTTFPPSFDPARHGLRQAFRELATDHIAAAST